MKLGLFCFANDSGLGNQTRRLAEMLAPERLLVIDSNGFSKNRIQHFDWYEAFRGYRVKGFPTAHQIRLFLQGLTHVLCVENPLNYALMDIAREFKVKVFIQTNYEFCDHLDKNILPPEKFIMPSHWKIAEMQKLFGLDKVMYLPPPLSTTEFKSARQTNFKRDGFQKKFLHVVGTLAVHDRNGTLDLIEAVKLCKEDFSLTIKSQHSLPPEYMATHPKINYQIGNQASAENLYTDFDAMILPRRYGGLCLTANEALMSGLPVIMPNISPNNAILPSWWTTPAHVMTQFKARVIIDVYQSNIAKLSEKIDEFALKDLSKDKITAFEIAHDFFSPSILKERYNNLFI